MLVRCVTGANLRPADRSDVTEGKPLGAALVGLLCVIFTAQAGAKTPGTVHCYGGWCHRVSTIDEMHSMVGQRGYLRASYYDDCRIDRFNACGLTSSGEVFRPDQADNAASPIFPDGTVLLTYNPENGNAAVLRVNSAGPYRGDRRLDVSRATAEKLGFKMKGVADLAVTVIKSPEPDDARYKKLRSYTRVPGYIGTFKSFDAAHDAAIVSLNMQFIAQTAALDNGLDPALIPADPRAALAWMPLVEVAAVPVWELVFAMPHVADAAASEIAGIWPVENSEVLKELAAVTLNDGPLPVAIADREGQQVVAAIDQAATAEDDLASQKNVDVARAAAAERGHLIKVGASFDGSAFARVAAFVEAAHAQARLKSARLAVLDAATQLSWSERAQTFVNEARLKARASVVQDGAIRRFTAELTLKARRYR